MPEMINLLECRGLGGDLIFARREPDDLICSLAIGGHGTRDAGRGISSRYGRTGDDGSCRVCHRSRQVGGGRLRLCQGRRGKSGCTSPVVKR